jgi:hypothetical protein
LKLRRSDRHARPLPTLGLRGAATSHKGRKAGSRPARATILSCRLSSMAERCVVAAEMLDRYRQAVPDIGREAHRQSGGLQNRVREGSIPSSPANLRASAAGLSPKPLRSRRHKHAERLRWVGKWRPIGCKKSYQLTRSWDELWDVLYFDPYPAEASYAAAENRSQSTLFPDALKTGSLRTISFG